MLCRSLESFWEHLFGERETEPDDMVEDLLLTSEIESRAADTGLVAMLFFSMLLPVIEDRAVVSSVLLSGTLIGIE